MSIRIGEKEILDRLKYIHHTCNEQDRCGECPLHDVINCNLFFAHPDDWDAKTLKALMDFIYFGKA